MLSTSFCHEPEWPQLPHTKKPMISIKHFPSPLRIRPEAGSLVLQSEPSRIHAKTLARQTEGSTFWLKIFNSLKECKLAKGVHFIKGVMPRSRVNGLSKLCSPFSKGGNSAFIAAIASGLKLLDPCEWNVIKEFWIIDQKTQTSAFWERSLTWSCVYGELIRMFQFGFGLWPFWTSCSYAGVTFFVRDFFFV